jgi:hypothetical protein
MCPRRNRSGSTTADSPGPAGRHAAGSFPSSHAPRRIIDVDTLRHPTEGSRFAIACVASAAVVSVAVAVLLSIGHAGQLAVILLGIVLVFLLIRLLLALWRIRLLADAVRVSPATLPDVQAVVDEVRGTLAYDGRAEVFVVDKIPRVMAGAGTSIALTSFFGVRVIVIEGEVVGDLSDVRERQQFVFLVATVFGALKARHTRWTPVLLALQLTGLTKLVSLFIYPWYRATVYTGDRIASACCGDLDTSLQAAYRALVGPEVAPHLRSGGLVQQALAARRNVVLRLSQLVRPVPHATNRYLELLSFATRGEPVAFQAFYAGLGSEADGLAEVTERLVNRRPQWRAVPLGAALAAALLTTGVAVGLFVSDSSTAHAVYGLFEGGGNGPTPGDPIEVEQVFETPGPIPFRTPSHQPAEVLAAMVPADLRQSCSEDDPSGNAARVVATLTCSSAKALTPDIVRYYLFDTSAGMRAAFDLWARNISEGECPDAARAKGEWWTEDGVRRGPIACFTTNDDDRAVLWGHDDEAVLVIALDPELSRAALYRWWSAHAVLAR